MTKKKYQKNATRITDIVDCDEILEQSNLLDLNILQCLLAAHLTSFPNSLFSFRLLPVPVVHAPINREKPSLKSDPSRNWKKPKHIAPALWLQQK